MSIISHLLGLLVAPSSAGRRVSYAPPSRGLEPPYVGCYKFLNSSWAGWGRGRLGLQFAPRVSLALIYAACTLLAQGAEPKSPIASAPTAILPVKPIVSECRWADGPVKIDGKADEEAWNSAQIITNFAMPWLGPGSHHARTATRARLLWDREYLYFYAEMEDADVFADITEHNGRTWLNDVFELFFKPARDKPGYYEFQVNAANTKLDMFIPSRDKGGYEEFKNKGGFHLDSAVIVRGTLNQRQDRDQGWSVEGRIPWRDFMRTGGRPDVDEEWLFTLCRYDYSVDFKDPALSATAPLTRASFHRVEDYAPLRFTGPRRSTKPFGIEQRVLWTNSQVTGSPDPPLPYRAVKVFPKLSVQMPVAMANEPGSERLLFLEHTASWGGYGKLRRIPNNSEVTTAETLLELEDIAYGLTFHPNFKENGYLYIGSNGPHNRGGKKTRVTRFTMKRKPPFGIDPASRLVIIEWDSDGHNGGDMVFGNDGMMYVTSGDGTSDSDGNIAGQDLTKLTSKVLRIDVDHPAEGMAYSIPKDNPFVKTPEARPETWAYGLRNPWRITVDRKTGAIWVGENGQDLWEMARVIQRGANYGWSIYEGSHAFNLQRKLGPTQVTKPTIEHPHSEFRSLTGGIVYYGKKLPKLYGSYIYGDWSTGRIWEARHNGRRLVSNREIADTPFAITGFGVDAEGELLVIDEGSGFYRLEATEAGSKINHFPTRLSETGLFVSIKENMPNPALIPYSVNSPLWSDGAQKERFIALPGDTQIGFTRSRAWTFPEGTVLVKTFALDLEEGNPNTRRRIETRLLTKQQNEWIGYSYLWNDAQSEATLVKAAGQEKEFVIRDAKAPGGKRRQTWHYPSRAECMMCHSRAANYVLGITEAQMNKTHQYGSITDHQFRALERLGVMRVDWNEYEREAMPRELTESGMNAKEVAAYMKQNTTSEDQRPPVQASALFPRYPEHMRRLPDPMDPKEELNARARSYLHANCAQCHVKEGGGNSLLDLEFTTALKQTRTVDARPQHHTFDIADARLLAPGDPERSVLLRRITNRVAGHMPPLATSRVDSDAVGLLRDWIIQLPRSN